MNKISSEWLSEAARWGADLDDSSALVSKPTGASMIYDESQETKVVDGIGWKARVDRWTAESDALELCVSRGEMGSFNFNVNARQVGDINLPNAFGSSDTLLGAMREAEVVAEKLRRAFSISETPPQSWSAGIYGWRAILGLWVANVQEQVTDKHAWLVGPETENCPKVRWVRSPSSMPLDKAMHEAGALLVRLDKEWPKTEQSAMAPTCSSTRRFGQTSIGVIVRDQTMHVSVFVRDNCLNESLTAYLDDLGIVRDERVEFGDGKTIQFRLIHSKNASANVSDRGEKMVHLDLEIPQAPPATYAVLTYEDHVLNVVEVTHG